MDTLFIRLTVAIIELSSTSYLSAILKPQNMSHSNINIHVFCSGENKISPNDIRRIEQIIWQDVKNKSKREGIILDFLYGASNQCFCIIALNSFQTIQTVQTIMNKILQKRSFFVDSKGISNKFKSPKLSAIFNNQKNNEYDWKIDIYTMQVSDSVFERISNYNQIELEMDNKKIFEINEAYVVQYSINEIEQVIYTALKRNN